MTMTMNVREIFVIVDATHGGLVLNVLNLEVDGYDRVGSVNGFVDRDSAEKALSVWFGPIENRYKVIKLRVVETEYEGA